MKGLLIDAVCERKTGYLVDCEKNLEEVLEASPTMSLEDLEEIVMKKKLEEGRRLLEIVLSQHPGRDAAKEQKWGEPLRLDREK